MDDAAFVRMMKRICDLGGKRGGVLGEQRPPLQPLA